MTSDYLKLYHLNGRRVKVATGTWEEIKQSRIPPLRNGESLELEGWTGREHFKYATGTFEAIRVKMEGAGAYMRKHMDDDAGSTILLTLGLCAWWALFSMIVLGA